MYCKQCKRNNPEENKFCEYCGAKLEPEAAGASKKFNKKLLLIIISVVVLVAAAVTTIGLVVHSRNTDDDISVKPSSSETPSGDTVYKKGSYDDYADDFIFPGSDERYLSENELADLNSEDTQQAINEIYARRGRIFKEEPYKSFFNGCKWYKPTYSAEEFKDKWFNEYEKKNIQLLSSHRDNVSVNIDSENAAIQYALDYCKENYNDIDIPIDGAMCEGKSGSNYLIRGYSDMGTYITTVFTWTITPDGDIYETDGGNLEYKHP